MPDYFENPTYVVVNYKIMELKLKKNVLLAYTDIAAAGSRALFGIGMKMEHIKLDIPEVSNLRAASVRPTAPQPMEQDFHPLQILNCMYEEFTVVVINTVLPGEKVHYVVNTIMDLCVKSNVEHIYLMAAVHLGSLESQIHPLYENPFFTKPVTSHPALPDDTPIQDPFFNTFIQMLLVEQIPTTCFLVPGHKASIGPANDEDGSKNSIVLLQDVLHELTRLRFNNVLSNSLLYQEKNEDNVDMVSMIYS
ncbi:uncharacterized protein LOC135497073 [Lineus longissimus]|uniref:uncharacterized protein LOC135497073 n=1 Tax=Lineus longissimus TaxID=88925 RepID=UPI002B4DB2BC